MPKEVILPANPDSLSWHFNTQVNAPYKNLTIYTLVEKLLAGKKTVANGNLVYQTDTATNKQITKIINRIFQMTVPEIISLWFRYEIIHLLIAINEVGKRANRDSYIPSTLALNSASKPHHFKLGEKTVYSCRLAFSPVVFSGEEILHDFWIEPETYTACKLGTPFSQIIDGLDSHDILKSIFLRDAFCFYLWNKSALIDIAPDFNSIIKTIEAGYIYHEITPKIRKGPQLILHHWAKSKSAEYCFHLSLLKELMKQKRSDLLMTGILAWPEIFANSEVAVFLDRHRSF